MRFLNCCCVGGASSCSMYGNILSLEIMKQLWKTLVPKALYCWFLLRMYIGWHVMWARNALAIFWNLLVKGHPSMQWLWVTCFQRSFFWGLLGGIRSRLRLYMQKRIWHHSSFRCYIEVVKLNNRSPGFNANPASKDRFLWWISILSWTAFTLPGLLFHQKSPLYMSWMPSLVRACQGTQRKFGKSSLSTTPVFLLLTTTATTKLWI